MNTISKARRFFETNGRDVDRARFAFHFGDGTLDELLEALGRYQNADGGFGHGLEVDIKAAESNPFATELALMVCLQADVPRGSDLLTAAVRYLEQSQHEDGTWRFTEGVYRHELAPWFKGWQWPNLNPTCTLGGLLRELQLGSEQLHARVDRLFEELARPAELLADDFYAARPYAYRFLPEVEQPGRELYRGGVLWWLLRQHVENKIADGGHFFEYIRGPQTYTGRHLPAAVIGERLDLLAAEQEVDGGWPTPYNEGWRGWVTVQNLLVLKAFGRT